MAQKRNQLIVAELDQMAASLEAKGNLDLASLIDEVSAELLTEATAVEAKALKAKKAPKPSKSNNKRRKTNKKKASAPKVVMSRADAKKILKAAHSELLDIASELLKDGDLKEARHIIRYAEEVKEEENKLLVDEMPEEVPAPMDMTDSEDEESEDEDSMDEESDDEDAMDEESDDEESDEEGSEDEDLADEEEPTEDDEDIEAMLRKYELGDDSPKAPTAPATPGAPAAESEKCEEPVKDPSEKDEESEDEESEDEESEDEESEDEESEDEESEDEEDEKAKTEKDAKVKLFSLAKKLAAAGETKLAYDIADLLDRKN